MIEFYQLEQLEVIANERPLSKATEILIGHPPFFFNQHKKRYSYNITIPVSLSKLL